MTYKICDTAKAVHRGTFMSLYTYFRGKIYQINDISFIFKKKLKLEKVSNPKVSKRKE